MSVLDRLGIPIYEPSPALWVVTTYFNPCRYRTRRAHYDVFAASLARSGIHLLTVECAFNDDAFELPPSPTVIQVRSGSLLWQKERLLNLAAAALPRQCRHVAWIDADVLFQNAAWAVETNRLLDGGLSVVQPFATALRLGPDHLPTTPPDRSDSFANVTAPNPEAALGHDRYDAHGHTGYAWAMRRDIFSDVGLYEHCIGGSADHFMAHAIYGDCGFCVRNTLRTAAQLSHFRAWARRFHDAVQGRFAAVPGELVHLWHGDHANRRYYQRMLEMAHHDYDPYADVMTAPGGALEWARAKPDLQQYFHEYFRNRKEDGDHSGADRRTAGQARHDERATA